jgi:hypothetical protein
MSKSIGRWREKTRKPAKCPDCYGAGYEAMYLFNRLGLADKDTKYAVVRCDLSANDEMRDAMGEERL